MSALGDRIKELREERGLSQEQLGSMIDVRQSHISRIEVGVHDVRFQTALRLAEALGVSVYDLLPDTSENVPA